MDMCPRFCENCPMIPEGITAELTGAHVRQMSDMSRFKFAHDAPELAAALVGDVTITATVVVPETPDGEEAATSTMYIGKDPRTLEELKQAVHDCQGPISVNWLQKLFRIRTRCGAVDNRYPKYID